MVVNINSPFCQGIESASSPGLYSLDVQYFTRTVFPKELGPGGTVFPKGIRSAGPKIWPDRIPYDTGTGALAGTYTDLINFIIRGHVIQLTRLDVDGMERNYSVGDKFKSFDELQAKVHRYEELEFVKLWIRNQIKYYEITYACIHLHEGKSSNLVAMKNVQLRKFYLFQRVDGTIGSNL